MDSSTNLKSIDEAIIKCEANLERHRGETRRYFRFIIYILIAFLVTQFVLIAQSLYNKTVVSEFKSQSVILVDSIAKLTTINADLYRSIEKHFANDTSTQLSYFGSELNDFHSANLTLAGFRPTLLKMPDTLSDKFFKPDTTSVYILYGIFILVFGVITSFYRYNLKEVSKYEHFLFGFERIRVAGSDKKLGYGGEVRVALTKDAFYLHELNNKSIVKSRRFESPIPGHPSSDFGTAILNKLFESVDITAKPKDSAG